jgi:poly(3-hydroxybutyrate) depolymerase
MAAVMLAAYPERFAGGSIVAGVPYGCASTDGQPLLAVQKRWFLWTSPFGEAGWAAYACGIVRAGVASIRSPPIDRSPEAWAVLVRDAGAPPPPAWPKLSLWQGLGDRTVHPTNLQELVEQWTAVHGIDSLPDADETTAVYRRRAFADATGAVRVEAVELPGLEHAMPVDPGSGPSQCGVVADYFVDRNVCAAYHIARFWGLTDRH